MQKHEERLISVCVSSSECFTKAVSSTRCHTVWPIRETCGCVCVRLPFQVDSGGPFSSFLVFSISHHRPLVSPLLFLLSGPPPFIPPSLPSPLEFRVCPSGTSSSPLSLSLGPVQAENTGVKANTSRGETGGRRQRRQRYNE